VKTTQISVLRRRAPSSINKSRSNWASFCLSHEQYLKRIVELQLHRVQGSRPVVSRGGGEGSGGGGCAGGLPLWCLVVAQINNC
jgi:hypothetical protein